MQDQAKTESPMPDEVPEITFLLAVDLGLRCGLAWYDESGSLIRYHSQHFASRKTLKRAIWGILGQHQPLEELVLEGDRHLADLWERVAIKRGASVRRVAPETWRQELLLRRQQRSGAEAKQWACAGALELIEESGIARPHGELRHDAAEAILIGAWGCLTRGWRDNLPSG